MKIAIPTEKGGLEDNVSSIFGRASTITFVDCDEGTKQIGSVQVVQNDGANAPSGAGVTTAQSVLNSGATVLLAGNCGPNAIALLSQANIGVYYISGNVKDAIEKFLSGTLNKSNSASQIGVNNANNYSLSRGQGRGLGRGQGRGLGRGQGRGLGRGQGRGLGRGRLF